MFTRQIRAASRRVCRQPVRQQIVLLSTAQDSTPPTKVRMSNSEAFVETMAANNVTDCFGIVGSAFMDALDIFPAAGIRFIPVAHEQNAAHMADGYARVCAQLFCYTR